MHIRGMMFDLDGTLADTIPICIQSYKEAFEQLSGRSYTEEEVVAHFGATEEGIFQKVLPQQWQEGTQRYYDIYARLQEHCEPFPGIKHALTLLKERSISLAIVTGRGAYTTLGTLEHLGVAHFFDIVEVGDVTQVIKKQAISKILNKWSISPQEAAYVGDTNTDMREALAAGVLPLGAAWAESTTLHRFSALTPITTFASVDSFAYWIDENIKNNSAGQSRRNQL